MVEWLGRGGRGFKSRSDHLAGLSVKPSSTPRSCSLPPATWDVGRTLEEFVNHSPAAGDLQILLVFCQHPAWFISLQPIETCGLLLEFFFFHIFYIAQ